MPSRRTFHGKLARLMPCRLGACEIVGPLGTGGMGEVNRARDTTLDRDVAIKVLPTGLARDPDRVQRLAREAKVLAHLYVVASA
jgi:eukaryotic-like serine/threonine-protein kinase